MVNLQSHRDISQLMSVNVSYSQIKCRFTTRSIRLLDWIVLVNRMNLLFWFVMCHLRPLSAAQRGWRVKMGQIYHVETVNQECCERDECLSYRKLLGEAYVFQIFQGSVRSPLGS